MAFCLAVVPISLPRGPTPIAIVLSLAGVLLPGVALFLGLAALREIENNPQVGGRALAMTGTAAAVLGVLWCLTVTLLLATRQLLE